MGLAFLVIVSHVVCCICNGACGVGVQVERVAPQTMCQAENSLVAFEELPLKI